MEVNSIKNIFYGYERDNNFLAIAAILTILFEKGIVTVGRVKRHVNNNIATNTRLSSCRINKKRE